jgi:broad specificity polyphosphatase/5'/3'-nucleotidase SurE
MTMGYTPRAFAPREALRACGEVVVVAPDRNRSGASHSLTLEVPLRVTRLDASSFHGIKSYAVKGRRPTAFIWRSTNCCALSPTWWWPVSITGPTWG